MPIRITHVTALVLAALAAGHRYGFDVMDATGLASGTVYPALRRLERAGLLRSRWEAASTALDDGRPRRRLYQLTAAGEAALQSADRRLSDAASFLGRAHPAAEPRS
jgi:DNA-binding PadR family transcriptional regulator